MGCAIGLDLRALDVTNQGVVSLGANEVSILNPLEGNGILCVAHDGAAEASMLVNRGSRDRGQAQELAIGWMRVDFVLWRLLLAGKIGVADCTAGQRNGEESCLDRLAQTAALQERGQNAFSVVRYSRQPAVRPTRIW